MAYFDTKTGSLEEAIKAAVGGKLDEERTYTVVHATKGKEVIKAKTSYDAAKKFAQMKRLKSTAGVDAYLMEEVELDEVFNGTKKDIRKIARATDNALRKRSTQIQKMLKSKTNEKGRGLTDFEFDHISDEGDAIAAELVYRKKRGKDPISDDIPSHLKKFVNEEVELDEKFSPKEIKMAIGIASDKRYAGGNMTGAMSAIEKIKKGLSKDPKVTAVIRKQNEGNDKFNPHDATTLKDSDGKKLYDTGIKEEADEFKPHMMYDPKTGKGFKADTMADHLRMKKMGYDHVAPKKEEVQEASGGKEEYQKFFNATMKKFGVKSPSELKGDDKKKFYDAIDAGWEGDNEKKESFEAGTPERTKHTLDTTPGQSEELWNETVGAMQKKNSSMREIMSKMWGVDEGHNPFKKLEDAKKEEKDAKKETKTMTGKPMTKVDIEPDMKEKKN